LNNQENLIIPLDDIKKKTFEEHQLLVGINKWSELYRFHAIFGEGKKTLANGFKRIVCCNKKIVKAERILHLVKKINLTLLK